MMSHSPWHGHGQRQGQDQGQGHAHGARLVLQTSVNVTVSPAALEGLNLRSAVLWRATCWSLNDWSLVFSPKKNKRKGNGTVPFRTAASWICTTWNWSQLAHSGFEV
jgi:hypothetical protein